MKIEEYDVRNFIIPFYCLFTKRGNSKMEMLKDILKPSSEFELHTWIWSFVPKTKRDKNKWLQKEHENHLSLKSLILILLSWNTSFLIAKNGRKYINPRKIWRGIWKNGFQEAVGPRNAEKNQNQAKNHVKTHLYLSFRCDYASL